MDEWMEGRMDAEGVLKKNLKHMTEGVYRQTDGL